LNTIEFGQLAGEVLLKIVVLKGRHGV